jgi:hypothetical protein
MHRPLSSIDANKIAMRVSKSPQGGKGEQIRKDPACNSVQWSAAFMASMAIAESIKSVKVQILPSPLDTVIWKTIAKNEPGGQTFPTKLFHPQGALK